MPSIILKKIPNRNNAGLSSRSIQSKMNQLLLALYCLLALFPSAVHAGGGASSLKPPEPVELLLAIESQNIKSIKKFIVKSPSPPNSDALTAAIKVGSLKIVKLLILAGADYQFTNRNGHGALALSVIYRKLRIAQYLLELGVDVNQKDRYGYTPLMTACEFNQIKIVEALLDGKADPNFHDNEEGASALHLAVALSRVEIAGLLIARGADINLKDKQGRTPRQISITVGNADLFKLLGYFTNGGNISISKKKGDKIDSDSVFAFSSKASTKSETHMGDELGRESSILTETLSPVGSPREIHGKKNKKRLSIDESANTQIAIAEDSVTEIISKEGSPQGKDITEDASFIPPEAHHVSLVESTTPSTQIDSKGLTSDTISTGVSWSSRNQKENSGNSRHRQMSSHGLSDGRFVNSIEESKIEGAMSSNIQHNSTAGQVAGSEKTRRVSYVSSFSDRKKTNQTGTHLELMSALYEQWDYAI